jgi:hypothetical protein
VAVHKHRNGWRGSISLVTPVYKTQAEAETALAELKAKVTPAPPTQAPPAKPPGLDPAIFRPSWALCV